MRQPQSTGYDITGSRFALAGLRGRSGGPDYFEQVLRLPTPRGLPVSMAMGKSSLMARCRSPLVAR